jgi:integrase
MTTAPATGQRRTPPKRKARQLAKHLRDERPDYAYLKAVFRALRDELDVQVEREPKTLPYVPSEDEIRRYYQTVWQARRSGDMVLIKTLLYTGVRVAELVAIRIADVDLDACRIRITLGKGAKDRVVPFPHTFRETLALHIADRRKTGGAYLFESSWKKPLLHPRRPGTARPLRERRRSATQHVAPPAAALPVHLAQDPRHRRRPHSALQRPRQPAITRDLQPARPHRRPSQLRPGHRPIPRLKIIPVCGWRHVQEFRAWYGGGRPGWLNRRRAPSGRRERRA